jgi:hypothetical protein
MSETKNQGGIMNSLLYGKLGIFEKETHLARINNKQQESSSSKKELMANRSYETAAYPKNYSKSEYQKANQSNFERDAFFENKEFNQYKAQMRKIELTLDTSFNQDKVFAIYRQLVIEKRDIQTVIDFCYDQRDSSNRLHFSVKKNEIISNLLLKANLRNESLKEAANYRAKIRKLKEQFDSENNSQIMVQIKDIETKLKGITRADIKTEVFNNPNIERSSSYNQNIGIVGGKEKIGPITALKNSLESLQRTFYTPKTKRELSDGRTKVTKAKFNQKAIAMATAGMILMGAAGYKISQKSVDKATVPLTEREVNDQKFADLKFEEIRLQRQEKARPVEKFKLGMEPNQEMPKLSPEAKKSFGAINLEGLRKALKATPKNQ